MKLSILSSEGAQDSEFCLFLRRIQEATICFQNLLTFRSFLFFERTEGLCQGRQNRPVKELGLIF